MITTLSISSIEIANRARNLYKHNGLYFRLFAKGITPNGCWLVAPYMLQLIDIDAATGEDVYGQNRIEFIGMVESNREYVKYFD
jgi:hypothetical protein